MDWKDIATKVAQVGAPILGTLVGGPAGAAVGTMIASALGAEPTPEAVAVALANPDAAVKLREVEARRQVELHGLLVQAEAHRLAAESAQIASVNATMQAEAQSSHWPTYTWRPYCGFVFGTTFFGVYFVLPLLKLPVPAVPFEAWASLGAILGVASWFRGKAQADPTNPMPIKG